MKTIIIIFISFILTVNSGYSQSFEWAKNVASSRSSGARAIDKDVSGKTYLFGNFDGSITFGSTTLTGTNDIYIANYDQSGIFQWAVKAGGSNFEIAYDIACDNSGNSYITGVYNGTATFGTTTLTSLGNYEIFIAKYNSSGVFQWAKSAGSSDYEWGINIAVDNSGNCFVTGEFFSTISFGSATVTTNGDRDVFLAKYSSEGDFQWAVSGGSGYYDLCGGVTSDASGNVYLSGMISGPANFSGHIITTIGYQNIFYIKYDPNGDLIWGYNDANGFRSWGIGVDSHNDSYVLNDYYLSKHLSDGSFSWQRSWSSSEFIFANSFKTDILGNNYVCGTYSGTAYFPPYSVVSAGQNDIFVVKYNADGDVEWVTSGGGTGNERSIGISADISGSAFITGEFFESAHFGSITLNSTAYNDDFIAKISSQANLITGKVFIDYDNNGVLDISAEPVFPYIIVSGSAGTNLISSNSSGDFHSFCGTGLNSVRIPFPPLYYTPNPVSWPVNFSGYGNISSNADLGLYPTPGINDLRVILSENSRARPGFNTTQLLTYKNAGTTTLSGTITLLFDNNLQFISSIPAETDIAANLLTWDYSNLSPNETRDIYIEYSLPSTVALATILTSDVTIEPVSGDFVPTDNVYILKQTARRAFDPNDKSVEPAGNLTLQNIHDEDSLTYTIRFQNTGTDTAFTVKVTDTLSSKLNTTSVETISSSHNYSFSIKNGNILVWTFENILLPDSTTNEVRSHGFIKYRIRPKNNLVIGDVINNSANIYFDFNEPVITNTAITRVSDVILPVELSSFISSVNLNNVTLKWTTEIETNNSGFDVERSNIKGRTSDEWTKISFVQGHGTITTPNNYEFTDRNLASGKYNYRLKQIDFNGNYEYYDLNDEVVIGIPEKFELSQNYPNPFNPSTNLEFRISNLEFVSLKVYDIAGKEVATLVNEIKPAGRYQVKFDGSNLGTGVYFYKIEAGSFSAVKRMILIK